MITIPISEVKKFISAAKPIKDTRMLPIYAYVKLECEGTQGVFYKANGTSFVICQINATFKKNQTLLIEEKTLFGFVHYSSGSEIEISIKGDVVTLNDGTRNISCRSAKIEHFPAIQDKNGEDTYVMNDEILAALFLAKNHTLPPPDAAMRPPASYVHLNSVGKDFYIAAWNGHIAYLKKFKEQLPVVSLEPETISVFARFPLATYSRCGNYDYFDLGAIAYGFIKNECKTSDLSAFVTNSKHTETFVVSRKPIVDFCEMVINVNSSSVPPIVSIEPSKEKILMRFQDASENQNAEEGVEITGRLSVSEFLFQPKNMLTVLKDLGCEKITISYAHKNFLITSDEDNGYVGSIMQLSRL